MGLSAFSAMQMGRSRSEHLGELIHRGKTQTQTEAIAGITTFFTMVYIVVVNPQILSADGKTGMAFNGVLTATVLICFTMTLPMGLYAKLPFAVAPQTLEILS